MSDNPKLLSAEERAAIAARAARIAEMSTEDDCEYVESVLQLADSDIPRLQAHIEALEAELRRWRGCPSCKEDHDDSVMCPPHEVRTSGRAWFHTQARKWAERAERAEQRVKELEAECDNLRVMFNDSQIALHSASHRADEATSARRQAEKERNELKRKLDACQCETRVLNESMLIEVERERDQLAAEVERLREVVDHVQTIVDGSVGIAGWHLNGAIAEWNEFDVFADELPNVIATTPHAAKAAERVKATGDVVKEARYFYGHYGPLNDALDRLDATGAAEGDSDAAQSR